MIALVVTLLVATNVLPVGVEVRSVDRVAAFSEDGRAALVERVATTSHGLATSRSWLVVDLDNAAAPISAPIDFSLRAVSIGAGVADDLVDARDCRARAQALEPLVRARFFGVARVEPGACSRISRQVVDIKRNLRITALDVDEVTWLTGQFGGGSFVAAPDGPLVVQLVTDGYGNVQVYGAIARPDTERIRGRW